MGENYVENLVSREPSTKTRLLTILAATGAVIFACIGLVIWLPACIPAVLCGVLAWFLAQRILVEYEYLLLDHELSVDVIYGKTRRKKMMNCPLKKIESFAPEAPGRTDHLKRQRITVEDYSSQRPGDTHYLLECTGEKGKIAFLMTPGAELLAQLQRELPRAVMPR